MSRRLPVSIVILAWNAWKETQACLESLRPTLGLHDQVIVVDNGSTDATASRLRLFSWLEVVHNEENRGFAAGCNQGAAEARNDVVVFLNNDTVLTRRWLDPLVEPFDVPGVAATGPRSNFVSGPQVAEGAAYAADDRSAIRAFARQWADGHRGEVTPTDRLVGFCLAVRRTAFETAGGFDEGYEVGGFEDDDLCRRLIDAGWNLLIAHESFVHHAGHRTFDANEVDWFDQQERNRARFEEKFGAGSKREFPLVSACLIVKDEEANLPRCLASLEGFADEVVVYDTGSTDSTVDLARRAGAAVVEGYWDDDFSRARNVALASCHGEWVAWLDADEMLVCDDVAALRQQLVRTGPEVDGYSVPIENVTGSGVGAMFVHSACRLFRRSRCEWTGRLHEQVAGRDDHRPVATMALERARIHHTGYTSQAMAQRSKAERNLRVAEAEVERADGWERGFSLTSLGRSYMTAGRPEEALQTCRRGAAETQNPITRRLALRTVVEALVALGRPEDALDALDELRQVSDRQVLVTLLETNIRRQTGDHVRALELLDTIVGPQFDDDGFEYDESMFAQQRSESLAVLGRHGEAADALLAAMSDKGVLDAHLGTVVEYLQQAGRPLTDLAAAIPPVNHQLFMAQILQLIPETADQVLGACVAHAEQHAEAHTEQHGEGTVLAVLATAATVAASLSIERALVWSSCLRARGLGVACPLVAIATDQARSPVDRARAAGAGYQVFGDDRLASAFPVAYAVASPDERCQIAAEITAICPQLMSPPGSEPGTVTKVSIIIPCWNQAEYTTRCLASIQAHTPPGTYEVILIDNGSTDATASLTSAPEDRSLIVHRNGENLGFARACNQGASLARTDRLVFLNNDTEVLPGWLPPLMTVLDQHPDVGIVGCRLLYPDGTLQHAGVVTGRSPDGLFDGHHRFRRQPGTYPPALTGEVLPAVTGACMAVRRHLFEDLGGFDELYYNGNEDVDLCLAAAKCGWSVYYEPASCVIHHESISGPERFVSARSNRERLTERWSEGKCWSPSSTSSR
ncbi:MAG TPA: glycosyltransferase [Acidimicrobiales bacterium]|nr:glycosyltransferase [Acidimicrobiales bacterium]